ncbi:hypothetical protein RHECNPAF_4300104 [Rhizobium etli CNPAF512]|nr:hypothetical protein RHECNPAF_4300104 [Rhizobium etli CNPAF512]
MTPLKLLPRNLTKYKTIPDQ